MRRKKNRLVQPFVKWAGGKRQLLCEIRKYIPKQITTYYEPFVGGGAVLLDLQPKKAVINDINSDVINVYETIRDDVEGVIKKLRIHKNEKAYYYKIREQDRTKRFDNFSNVTQAERIIYLNKTCYNGLFRVNSQGQFNVPFGRYKNPQIVNEVVLRAVSRYLNEAEIKFLSIDFSEAVKNIKKGGFVYFDPPYDPISDTSSFTGYTLNGFDEKQQLKLKELCDDLNSRGCKFLLSNSATPYIRELYKNYTTEIVWVNRPINSDSTKRGKIDEVLVRNYE